MSLSFRTPTTDDLDAILDLINDPQSVHRRTDCRHGAVLETVSHLYDRLDEDENLVAVAPTGPLMGFASWQAYGRHAHLNVLAVAGAAQRMGVGRGLFEAFLARLVEDGFRELLAAGVSRLRVGDRLLRRARPAPGRERRRAHGKRRRLQADTS